MIVGIGAHIYQLFFTSLCILTVLHRTHPPFLGSHDLHRLAVRKSLPVVIDTTDTMFLFSGKTGDDI